MISSIFKVILILIISFLGYVSYITNVKPIEKPVKIEKQIQSLEIISSANWKIHDNIFKFKAKSNNWKMVKSSELILSPDKEMSGAYAYLNLKRLLVSPVNDEWIEVISPFGSFEEKGITDRNENLYLILKTEKGEDTSLEIDGFSSVSTNKKMPIVSITIDDGIDSTMTAFKIMKEFGLKGSIFIEPKTIGKPGFLTKEDLDTISKSGWDIGGHLVETNPKGMSPGELESLLGNIYQGINQYPGSETFAYPNGRMPAQFVSEMNKFFHNGLSINGFNNSLSSLSRTKISRHGVDLKTSLSRLKGTIGNVYNDDWIIFNFHIFESNSDKIENYTPENFIEFCKFLKENNIRVVTITEGIKNGKL